VPSFRLSATRHYHDADFLNNAGRHINADHLAGVAAECAIKSILCGPAGLPVPSSGPPKQGTVSFSHLPQLWASAGTYLSGITNLSIPQLSQMLAGGNPFASWSVHDRYEDGNAIPPNRTQGHLAAAKQLVGVVEQAVLSGLVVS
jgi:hypothetical protein